MLFAAIATLFIHHSVLASNPELAYQLREEHWEGIQARSVSGDLGIELLSAMVDYSEPQTSFPATNKILFYLTDPAQIDLTVRELSLKEYYLLNRVKEQETWQQGFNHYQWSAETVLKPLNLKITQLGAVARVNRAAAREEEQVAPVVLYHTSYPSKINGYRFAFKVGSGANLDYVIYADNSSTPLLEKKLGKRSGGEPFVILWDCSKAPAGYYELVVDGHSLRDNSQLHQSVKFYHQPEIKGKF
jgi:hypothetical protein